MKPLTALVLALLVATSASAQPVPNPDLGDGFFGLEPDPPAPERPSLDVVSDSLGIITELDLTGLAPGDEVLTQLGDASILTEMTQDGSLITTVLSDKGVANMQLPPLESGVPSDLTMLITPATVVVDRVGDNPVPLEDPLSIVDGTLVTWGLIEDLGPLGLDGPITDPPEIQAPAGVDAIADQIPLISSLDPIMTLVMIDPEDNILLGTLQEHTSQLPVTDDVFETASSITSALNLETLTGLDVNSVLSGLASATDAVGAVDTNLLGTNLEDITMKLRVVDLPIDDPKVILDPNNLEMILVDGGLGKITAIPGEEKLVFDNDLVTALKNPQSTDLTSFVAITKHGPTEKIAGITKFHPSLGNYDQLLKKTDSLTKNGITSTLVPQGVSCKQQIAAAATNSVPTFCGTPGMPTIPVKGGKLAGGLANPSLNPKMPGTGVAKAAGIDPKVPPAPGLPGGPAAPGGLPKPFALPMGSDVGKLTQFPLPQNHTLDGGTVGYLVPSDSIKGVPEYGFGDWKLPETGVGSIPEIEPPNVDATKNLECVGPCLPDHELTVMDGIMEGFQAPAMPGTSPVVPLDGLTGVLGTVTDAAGNGLTFLPLDMLNKLPIGITSEVNLRFVGDVKSLFAGTGVHDVRVQVESSDPLGLSKVTSTYTTNNNGYVSIGVPALGTYHVQATKEGFQGVEGSGQAGPPGSTSGQEYTMYSHTDGGIKDKIKNNGALWGLLLVAGLLGAFWLHGKYKHRKKKGKRPPRGGATRLLVIPVALLVAMAGCLSPQDQDKAQDVKANQLLNKHLLIECDLASDGHKGIHVELRDCDNGRVTSGHLEEAEWAVSGQKDVGSWRANRNAQITGTVYYPAPLGNDPPYTFTYSVESGKTGAFDVTVRIPLDKSGLGNYKLCFNLGGFKDTSSWKPGLQGSPDPTEPDPTCTTYRIGKSGLGF